jgi:hypothetical protein
MLEHASWKSFHDQLHKTFQLLTAGGERVRLELCEVTQPVDAKFSPGMEQFSLIFRGPSTPYYPQGIYTLEHESLGCGQLFIVPIGPDAHGMCYQVAFSRVPKGSA